MQNGFAKYVGPKREYQRNCREEVMGIYRSNPTNDEAGFSMIELVVVVLIAGIITAASVMMFAKGKARYQLSQKAQNLTWQIERARSLAVKYNQTLTLGFTSQNSVFGITCTSCSGPKSELPPFRMPANITLSDYPTMTIKGNGTITASNATIVLSDPQGRQVPITIANSGRTTVGDVSDTTY
jgi:prepilin-type N-terminal cleavage/methylation domain-containing protein